MKVPQVFRSTRLAVDAPRSLPHEGEEPAVVFRHQEPRYVFGRDGDLGAESFEFQQEEEECTVQQERSSLTDGNSTQFTVGADPSFSVAASEDVAIPSVASLTSRAAASEATTVAMGTGRNPRAKRRPPKTLCRGAPATSYHNRRPSIVSTGETSSQDPNEPLWRQATEESHVRRFSMKSDSSNNSTSGGLAAGRLSFRKALSRAEEEKKEDPSTNNNDAEKQDFDYIQSPGEISSQQLQSTKLGAQPQSEYRFEFGDVVTPHGRSNLRDNEGNGSIYSFSFSQDDEGAGFELDDFQLLGEGLVYHCAGEKDTRDDPSSSSSTCNLEGGVNMTDRDLIERCTSPGALRLTAEGLFRHEEDTFKQELIKETPADPFEAWKQGHDAKKWFRQRQSDKNDRTTKEHQQGTTAEISPRRYSSQSQRLDEVLDRIGASERDDDTHPSTAKRTDDDTHPSTTKRTDDDGSNQNSVSIKKNPSFTRNRSADESGKLLGLGKIFRKRSNISRSRRRHSGTTMSCAGGSNHLSDRELAIEVLRKEALFKEKQERERIEAKRRAYLDSQRSREGVHQISPRRRRKDFLLSQSSSEPNMTPPSVATLVTRKKVFTASAPNIVNDGLEHVAATTKPPAPVVSKPMLPPCVFCHRGQRTHIAMPCMHFSFCMACAVRLGKQKSCSCPVCNRSDVSFAEVSV